MVLPLSLVIGLRLSRSHHRSNTISLISMISIIGIALGVSVLIIGLSAMNGFKNELNNRILTMLPHAEIESIHQPWKNWNETLKKIKRLSGVIYATPYINFNGLVDNGTNLHIIQIKGINLQQEKSLSTISNFVQNESWINFKTGEQQIILGKGIADELKIDQNDWVSIMIPTNGVDNKLQQLKHIRLHVIGILNLSGHLDHIISLVPLKDASKYLNIGNSITGIAIKVNNIFNVNKLLKEASKIINSTIRIKSWMDTYSYIYNDIKMIRTIIYLTMILIILLSCFNIVSTLVLSVKNNSRDIAILRTIGAKDSLVGTIFVWYGLLVGLTGSICGSIIGILVSLQLTPIVNRIEKLIGYKLLSDKIYFVNFIPSELHWRDVFYVLVMTFSLSLLASWYPAHRANRVDPTSIL